MANTHLDATIEFKALLLLFFTYIYLHRQGTISCTLVTQKSEGYIAEFMPSLFSLAMHLSEEGLKVFSLGHYYNDIGYVHMVNLPTLVAGPSGTIVLLQEGSLLTQKQYSIASVEQLS